MDWYIQCQRALRIGEFVNQPIGNSCVGHVPPDCLRACLFMYCASYKIRMLTVRESEQNRCLDQRIGGTFTYRQHSFFTRNTLCIGVTQNLMAVPPDKRAVVWATCRPPVWPDRGTAAHAPPLCAPRGGGGLVGPAWHERGAWAGQSLRRFHRRRRCAAATTVARCPPARPPVRPSPALHTAATDVASPAVRLSVLLALLPHPFRAAPPAPPLRASLPTTLLPPAAGGMRGTACGRATSTGVGGTPSSPPPPPPPR